ncbi:sugar kinase [Microbacterium trichothecenolyticum]|uniref:2-dehydro-3-deoxygluconokinase n=1 Tax=Microbacterium trichothecenolyticum TaxID=69370 RepID=A0ABU0TWX0_MICTR|nr:sugar kinase [Microbacterium trichothecenolyticum]MDQ1124020.1 2-dehydro-3-deoxygluconokinase [Microbacterium trichothecenolyticum]
MAPDATPPHDRAPLRRSEVLCIGEAMVLGAVSDGASLSTAESVRLHVAGAEANVARGLAARGVAVEWWSRLGDDPFGERVLADLTRHGVDHPAVVRDERRPTGVYFKERRGDTTVVRYYRAGSAASVMSVDDLDGLRLGERRLIHLSGISPALSPRCDALVEHILRAPRTAAVSFDVNHRPALWPDTATAAERLRVLADAADVVFVGRDEAERLWGCSDAQGVRAVLPSPRTLVVKDADVDAVALVVSADGTDAVHRVPALAVDVVEPVGAGDAFAAGYLAGWLTEEHPRLSLRSGHLMAAHALRSSADVALAPVEAEFERLRHLDDDEWSALRVADESRPEKAIAR